MLHIFSDMILYFVAHFVLLNLEAAPCFINVFPVDLCRKPLSWLSVHANGAVIPKNFIDKDLAKKDTW